MSSFVYNHARSDFATAALNWLTCTPKAMLVDAGYTPSLNDQFVSSIPTGAIVSRDAALTNVLQANGYCSGLVPQFNALIWPNPVVAVILYNSTGNDATSKLIYYSSDGFGFPFLALGFNYAVAMDQAYGAWFAV